MHERHVIDDLIHKIIESAKQARASKVTKISVKLGALSNMSPSHFKEHFDIASRQTIAENAQIEIETSNDINDPGAARILLKSLEIL
jgi:hydrogenase nickel incorporation protein HypA/HybF